MPGSQGLSVDLFNYRFNVSWNTMPSVSRRQVDYCEALFRPLSQQEVASIKGARRAQFTRVEEKRREHVRTYATPEVLKRNDAHKNKEDEYRHFLIAHKWFRLYRKTPEDRIRFFANLFISRPFALGCGLTVLGSFITAMVALAGMAPWLAAVIGLPMLIFTTLVNWRITQKKVPMILSNIFLGVWFRNLFRYSDDEYKDALKEYYAEMDDSITALRKQLATLNGQIKRTRALGRAPSWWLQRKQQKIASQLEQWLAKRNDTDKDPGRYLPWYKIAIVALSIPLNLAGGVIFGVLTYALAGDSIGALLGIVAGTAFVATPLGAGIITGVCIALGIVTAPAITGIFIFGVSGLVKARNSVKKSLNFLLDFFRATIDNPAGDGKIKVFTPGSVLKGALLVTGIFGLIGLVTFGQGFQMIGGGKVFLGLLGESSAIFSMYILPAMACASQLPFYWLQSIRTARSWVSNGLDYFRCPLKVGNKRIQRIQALALGGEIGVEKAKIMIADLEAQQLAHAYNLKTLSQKKILGVNVGKYLVKYTPHWLRSFVNTEVPRMMNAIGNGFISLVGALLPAGGGSDAASAADTPAADASTSSSSAEQVQASIADLSEGGANQALTPDTSHSLTPQDIVADLGGVAASRAAACSDPEPPAPEEYTGQKHRDTIRSLRTDDQKNTNDKFANLMARVGWAASANTIPGNAATPRTPLLGAVDMQTFGVAAATA